MTVARPLVVAHKGASGELPGNTIPAFDLAVRQGADCLELDVQLTGDGRVVVHDRWWFGPDDDRQPVASATLDRLRAAGPGLLTLDEVLEHLEPARIGLVVELKNSRLWQPPDAAVQVAGLLRRAGWLSRSYLLSFDHALIAAARGVPGVRTGLLYVGRLADAGRALRETGATFLETRNDFLSAEYVAQLHGLGALVCSWTTNDPAEIAELAGFGVDLVTTDLPGLARRVLDGEPTG